MKNFWITKKDEWKRVEKALIGIKFVAKVGLYGDGNTPEDNLAYLGAIHELGDGNGGDLEIQVTPKMRAYCAVVLGFDAGIVVTIPRRPFMSMAWDDNLQNNKLFYIQQYDLMLEGKITAQEFLNRMGLKYQADIQNMIKNGAFVENHPITILHKGSSKPLISSGRMLNAITYKLKAIK